MTWITANYGMGLYSCLQITGTSMLQQAQEVKGAFTVHEYLPVYL